ncbi:hypothetical protein J6590_056216 [Homalodisca vitripennis]|nr:hypothetical protein J6590_056216 [Homalodisca vitripennis]
MRHATPKLIKMAVIWNEETFHSQFDGLGAAKRSECCDDDYGDCAVKVATLLLIKAGCDSKHEL